MRPWSDSAFRASQGIYDDEESERLAICLQGEDRVQGCPLNEVVEDPRHYCPQSDYGEPDSQKKHRLAFCFAVSAIGIVDDDGAEDQN